MKISVDALTFAMMKRGIFTYASLADKMGGSPQSLSLVKGRGTCSPATLAKLAAALEVDPAELLLKGRDEK